MEGLDPSQKVEKMNLYLYYYSQNCRKCTLWLGFSNSLALVLLMTIIVMMRSRRVVDDFAVMSNLCVLCDLLYDREIRMIT